ncbi:hypothetical protein RchiOBHm_Chr2g0086641 [Rosa chinensis]|uniref:Uncharacterized protein n=1 Tax=Rosa chinensis TaxID=74649 RepID=A0A2P6RIF8_ROSCH|nr:hypothetical protein RchiOBHm_Chr2g0086641 [Rosa chinensis]
MATKMMLQCVLEGSISVHDMEVEHRPYHRNCSCAMHKMKGSCSNDACSHQSNISFPRKQPQSCCWLNTTEQRRLSAPFHAKYTNIHSSGCSAVSTAQQEEKRGNRGTKACHIYLTESSEQDDFLSTLYSFF